MEVEKRIKIENISDPKIRLENLKRMSSELRDYAEEKFPELLEEDVDFLTKLLGMEIKKLFCTVAVIKGNKEKCFKTDMIEFEKKLVKEIEKVLNRTINTTQNQD